MTISTKTNVFLLTCYFLGTACGQLTYSLASGESTVFQSPGFSSSGYSDNMFCQWTFTSPADTYLTFTFTAFNVESGYDYVYIGTEAGVGPLSRLNSYTGSTIPDDYQPGGNTAAITLATDGSVTEQGFSVTVTASGEQRK